MAASGVPASGEVTGRMGKPPTTEAVTMPAWSGAFTTAGRAHEAVGEASPSP